MSRWFVSRHPGAIAWMRQQPIQIDHWVVHLDPTAVSLGDQVYGNLPVPLVARLCQRGARYFHLQLDVPAELRGRELTADTLNGLRANLCEYVAVHPDIKTLLPEQ